MAENSTNDRWNRSQYIGLIPAALAFVFMVIISWRKWPDPIIDFGGQLYIPWQLSMGKVLYRDVMYLPGPVSQYYNAFLFEIFGVSLTTLLISNLAILIGFVVLVYRLFLNCADRLTAGAIALSVVAGFGFAEYLDVGNYNYICPYSHEIWHAIVLSLVLVACMANWLKTDRTKWLFFGGLCYGTTFLTKPENFVAATAIVFGGIFLAFFSAARGEKEKNSAVRLRQSVTFIVATILPLLGMFGIFAAHEDAQSSIRGVCGAWLPLVTTKMASGTFFKVGMGLDVPFYHLRLMLQHFAVFAGIIAICAWRFRANQNRIERLILICAFAGLSLNFDWTHCGRSLPLILLCALGTFVVQWKRADAEGRTRLVAPLLWTLFSLLLLLKMGVYPRIVHYGIFLAMPAFLAAVYFLLHLLPNTFSTRIEARHFRMVMALLLLVGLVRLGIHSALFYKDKDFSIGQGSDRILTYNPKVSPIGKAMDEAISWIKTNSAPDATVAALPEGAMVNYLSRRRNPTPYIVFMSEIYAFGEETMAAPYRANPPDYILLVHRDTGEYGLDFFGRKKGYGLDMLEWINTHYEPIKLIGAEPLRTADFGIKILKKR